jgi:prepilin-type N-terminal cleavage/methylation domain-containing protein
MNRNPPQGFTLVEIAVVLVIVGLLLGGLLLPLSSQVENSRISETREMQEAVRDALLGYAMLNGRLPCPDTNAPPNDDGLENAPCGGSVASGWLPWATLGLGDTVDAWGQPLRYSVNTSFTTVSSLTSTLADTSTWSTWEDDLHIVAGSGDCVASPPVGNHLAKNVPVVLVSGGKPDTVAGGDDNENADGDNCFVSRDLSTVPGQEFNDLVIWISPNLLYSRLVEAGKLP